MEKLLKGIKILQIFNSNSFEAYIVGGSVRDYLLNKPINDVDITTNATVDEICSLFDNVEMEGSKYLGCRLYFEGEEFEITTFRKDLKYLDHRHPISIKVDSIEEDLVRRDFTINAFAMDKNYNIIDLFNGKKDLSLKIIRTIGDPSIRFEEDALRVLRALYFSSKLDFDLDISIINSFKNDYVKFLKEEYVKDMLLKILSFESNKGLKYISEYKILKSYPFYQQIVDLCIKYNVKENIYALYLIFNNEFPTGCLITKKEKNKALTIYNLIKNNFSKEALFSLDIHCLKEAVELYNMVYENKQDYNTLLNAYNNLIIHSSKEINFDFKLVKQRSRSYAIKEVVRKILNNELANDYNDIKEFLESGDLCE